MSDSKPFSPSDPLPTTRDELIAEQVAVAQLQPPRWEPEDSQLRIAGSFVAFPRGLEGAGAAGDRLWAAVAVLERRRAAWVAHSRRHAPAAPGAR